MLLKKKKSAVPEEPRSTIQQVAKATTAPGQRILSVVVIVVASFVILGGVSWRYLYPIYREMNAKSEEGKVPEPPTPTAAPKLHAPMDLDAAAASAAAVPQAGNGELFSPAPGLAGDARPSPPPAASGGQIGGSATGGTGTRGLPPGMAGQPTGGNTYPSDDDSSDEITNARNRKYAGDLGNFGSAPGDSSSNAQNSAPGTPRPMNNNVSTQPVPAAGGFGSAQQPVSQQNGLAAQLTPISTPNGEVGIVPNPHLTLRKGTPITCTLDTAIQTDQFGFVECTTDYPIYSMDGKVVLAERGTKINGEYTRDLARGSRSIFVLWTRATTPAPHHVTFDLLSPGTDTLGRAGISGQVDNKYWERYGGALMYSVLEDATAVAAARATQGGGQTTANTVLLPSTQATGQSAIAELLKQGADVKPSLYRHHGDTISITVARNIDFSKVYRLKLARTGQ
ncbi:MAG TPA: TrbI/VirB10 family protein [Noviherbaspirillum sp.]|nr:TrbI/VirB10 family protein [Noviherbaspirillum sp.]